MKRLIFALLLVAGTLVATTSDAQMYRGRIGYGFAHRGYFAPRVCLPTPPIPTPYFGYGGGVEIAPPVFGYGYRHYNPYFYHGRRFGYRRRW